MYNNKELKEDLHYLAADQTVLVQCAVFRCECDQGIAEKEYHSQ